MDSRREPSPAEARERREDLGKVKPHRIHYVPKEGQAFNPLRSWPRNEKCFCGSGLKFKKCCISRTSVTIEADKEPDLRRVMQARLNAGEALRVLKQAVQPNEPRLKAEQEGQVSPEAPQEAPNVP